MGDNARVDDMSMVQIKFKPYFREPMLAGVKTCTSRTKRMGEAGDRFAAFGATFQLLAIDDVSLYEVSLLWKEEGCTSREHFLQVWNEIHPRAGYSDYQRVYLHAFKKVNP